MIKQILSDIKKIEDKLDFLHREVLQLSSDSDKRSKQLANCSQTAKKEHQADLYEIDQLRRKFEQEIISDESAIQDLHEMMDILIEKKLLKLPYKPPLVTTIPSSVSLSDIKDLFIRITEDSFSSAVGKIFKKNGYYALDDMVADFIRLVAEAELFLQNEIQQLKKTCSAEIAKQERIAELSDKSRKNNYRQMEIQFANDEGVQKARIIKNRSVFFASELISGFDLRAKKALADTGCFDNDWQAYNPKRKRNYTLVSGKIVIPFKSESVSLKKTLKQALPMYFNGENFILPLIQTENDIAKMYFNCSATSKAQVTNQIQLSMLRMLRNAPSDTFDIIVIDPVSRGMNLGILNASTDKNSKIGINVCNSKDEIRSTLKKLEKQIDDRSATIGSCANFAEYNKSNFPIKETILAVYDFPNSFDKEDIELFRIAIDNAKRCGITVFIASEYALPNKAGKNKSIASVYKHDTIDWDFLTVSKGNVSYVECTGTASFIESPFGTYDYQFENTKEIHKSFVESYRVKYDEGLIVDNLFANRFDVKHIGDYMDGTEGLKLPVMVRTSKGGAAADLVIGTSSSTHTLITGSTSSGKSTFLHMIITSIVMNYHPDDIELWLIDYGRVEFKKYLEKTPPHVRFISLEKGEEFTYSFLSHLKKFFTQREKDFLKANVSDIKEYRNKYGKLSMPRIVVIVDEFHNMTQHVQQNYDCRIMLENALAEYRKFGLSCIFSNQTISGLIGLTDTAKLQIKNRIALANEINEMKQTLAVSSDNYSRDDMILKMERTGVGELWYKEWTSPSDFSIEQFKGIYINSQERDAVLDAVIHRCDSPKIDANVIRIDSAERKEFPITDIQAHLTEKNNIDSLNLYLGTPVTIDKLFYFSLEDKYKQNILMIGREAQESVALMKDIVVNMILSASLKKNIKFIVYADPQNDLYKLLAAENLLRSKTCPFKIYTEISDICYSIYELSNQVSSRTQKENPTLILWLGLPDLYAEFEVSQNKSLIKWPVPVSDQGIVKINDYDMQKILQDEEMMKNAKDLGISVEEFLEAISLDGKHASARREKNDYSYNAIEDMISLYVKGGKFGIHNFVVLPNASEIRSMKPIDKDSFLHKIVLSVPKDDYYELGIRANDIDLEEGQSALYTNGLTNKKFKPFYI